MPNFNMTEKQMQRLLSRKKEMHAQTEAARLYIGKCEAELALRKQLLIVDELRLKNFTANYFKDE